MVIHKFTDFYSIKNITKKIFNCYFCKNLNISVNLKIKSKNLNISVNINIKQLLLIFKNTFTLIVLRVKLYYLIVLLQ